MYSTCTFCHAPLGANDAIEEFPVGRRLAFDAAKGRLWVVCAVCRQWNLSPLEERWDAIESMERSYRAARLRVATDQVGLARMRDGTELIRIGSPLRPEFAAWRYGDRFALRWRRYVAGAAVGVGAAAALLGAGVLAGFGAAYMPIQIFMASRTRRQATRIVAQHVDATGPITFTESGARGARIRVAHDDPAGWMLQIPARREALAVGSYGKQVDLETPTVLLPSRDGLEVARRLLPLVNRSGARRATVDQAVRVLEEAGDVHGIFRRAAQLRVDPYLGSYDAELRLALEMAAHEDLERRAFEGELKALEASWREAEAVAAIADELTLPGWVSTKLDRLR